MEMFAMSMMILASLAASRHRIRWPGASRVNWYRWPSVISCRRRPDCRMVALIQESVEFCCVFLCCWRGCWVFYFFVKTKVSRK